MQRPSPTKIILALLLFMLVLKVPYTYAQAFKPYENSDLFQELSDDTLYISSTSLKSVQKNISLEANQWLGPPIPRRMLQAMNVNFPRSYALGKISLDKKGNYVAYLLGTAHSKIYVFVYSTNKKDFVFKEELASYTYLESAYEKIRNSWITDVNHDGTLEIATWEKLIDFEFSNELAENSSKEDRFIYYLINDEFQYAAWSSDLLKNVSLKP